MGIGIEYPKTNSTPACDTESDADNFLPAALSGSRHQASGSAGGLVTRNSDRQQ
jgi:hypothetical protein